MVACLLCVHCHGKDNIQSLFPQKITIYKFQTSVKCQMHIILHLFCFKNNKYGLPKHIFLLLFVITEFPPIKQRTDSREESLMVF